MRPSDETLNRGPVFREMSRPVYVKDPSSRFRKEYALGLSLFSLFYILLSGKLRLLTCVSSLHTTYLITIVSQFVGQSV
jgi:hypothetical protein